MSPPYDDGSIAATEEVDSNRNTAICTRSVCCPSITENLILIDLYSTGYSPKLEGY
jgi:hypothetical protein